MSTKKMVGAVGLEPTTPALSTRCSNQLSYAPRSSPSTEEGSSKVVEPDGIEPTTYCLQSSRSSS